MIKKFLFIAMLVSANCFGQEICDNGIDDDGDGKIDINDPDCVCSQVQINSIITNPSFEDFTDCPSWDSPLVATGWIEANELSPDFINMTTCNYGGQSVPYPFPDGESVLGQIVSGGTEYIGSCLINTMEAGTNYQLTFNIAIDSGVNDCLKPFDPIDITLYGSPDCSDLPIPFGAYPNSETPFVILGSVYYNPVNSWGEVTITFTPTIDINSIIIGGPEFLPDTYDLTINPCRPYFLYDNLILNEASEFGINIQAEGNYCKGELVLTANPTLPVSTEATYQWYKEGIAIIGATNQDYPVAVVASQTGSYKVRIQDGNECFISSAYEVSGIMPGPEFTIVPPTCSTGGSITITTVADSYSFDNGLTWGTSSTKANLQPGTYSIKIKYNSGCISGGTGANLPVPVYLPAPSYQTTDAGCSPTGTITVTTTAAEYSFDNGATWTTNPMLNNLVSGIYQVKIKDGTGCVSDPAQVNVGQFYLPNPSYTTIQPACTTNGSITITTPAAEYSFDNGDTWTTNPVLSGIGAGSYIIVIKDTSGCVSAGVIVTFNATVSTPAYTYQPPGCGNNGSITITSVGSEYSFDNGGTWSGNPTLTGLGPGSYQIVYKNTDGCISYPFEVTLYETLLNYAPQATVVSAGCDPGSITITTAGSEYSFDGGITWQNTPTLSGLSAGSYVIMIKDTAGCKSQKKTIIVPSNPGALADPQYNVTPSLCDDNGSITITTPAAEYSFDNGATWGTANTALSLAPGNYTIKIKSATGCESAGVNVIVLQDIVPVPETFSVEYCQDAVALALTATGSDLLWYTTQTGGAGNTVAPIPSTTTTGTITYYVSQTIDACESGRVPLVVTILPIPAAPIAEDELIYCEGSSTVPLTATGTNLLWYTDENGIGSATAPTPSSSVIGTFVYYISQSNDGCESEKTAIKVIIKPTPLTPVTDNLINYELGDVAEMLTASGQNLKWYDHNNTLLPTAPTPSTTIIGTTTYYVTQTINGCESSAAEIQVVVAPNYVTIKFPNYFTPNGDTYHDTWNVFNPGKGIKVITYIFDRYGKLLTSVKSPGAGWDGTFNGHDLPASDYWFMATYEEFGMQKEVKAHFSLMR